MTKEQIALEIEYGKAISCYERALFYATNPPAANLDWEAEVNPSILCDQTLGDPPADSISYLYISSFYIDAGNMLLERLESVTENYFRLQNSLATQEIKVADRDYNFAKRSINRVAKNFARLSRDLENRIENRERASEEVKIDECQLYWTGLENMSKLFMDEISFTSARVDEFNGLLNEISALDKTNQSIDLSAKGIRYTYLGIFVAAAFSILSLIWSIFTFLFDNGKEGEESSSLLYLEVGKISSAVASLRELPIDRRGDTSGTTSPSNIPDYTAALEELQKSISAMNISLNRVEMTLDQLNLKEPSLTSIVVGLQSEISKIQVSIAENTFQIPQEVQAISRKIEKIEDEISNVRIDIAKLAPAVDNQKAPVVNVTPQVQVIESKSFAPPSVEKNSIGLLNIDASKTGAPDAKELEKPKGQRSRAGAPHK